MSIRLAIVNTHPIQYYAPVWRELSATPALDVHVFYGSDFSVRGYRDPEFGVGVEWDVPLTDGYAHTFLRRSSSVGSDALSAEGLQKGLQSFRADVALLTAYMPSFWWRAFAQVRRTGVPVLLRAEVTDAALRRGRAKQWLRSGLLSWLYSRCARLLAIGENARRHYLSHGVPSERIGWSPYCVDDGMLGPQVAAYGAQRDRLRRAMGFRDEHTVLVFSGKLVLKKDPMTLARALHLLDHATRERMGLVVMGEGELRGEFEAACRHALGDRCRFVGFVNQSELGACYAAGDCLVLPSAFGETWGLVVNEALQFGIPAIVSDRVGCHPDLIAEGRTGYVFPAGDAEALANRISQVAQRPAQRIRSMRRKAQDRVRAYSVAEAAAGIRDAALTIGSANSRAA